MQEVGMMQGDYFSELKEQLITNNKPTREEVKDNQSDDNVAKETLVVSKDSNSLLTQMMSFFMNEAERDKLREQEEKNERKSGKPLSEKTVDPSRLIRGNKGILGILQSFLTTAFLGPKGKALLQTLIPGRFTLGGFGKTLITGIAGVLFGPELVRVISNAFDSAMKEEGIGNMVLEGVKTFLKDADTSTLAAVGGVGGLLLGGVPGAIAGALLGVSLKGIVSALSGDKKEGNVALEAAKTFLKDADTATLAAIGGLGGLVLGGVPGAIAGALLGISVKAISSALANAKTEGLASSILEYITSAPGALAITAAYAGSKLSKKGGKLGKIGKMGMRGGIISLLIGPALDAVSDAMKPGEGEKGITTKVKEFLFSDKQNGMSLLEAAGQGALVGFSVFGWKGAIVGAIVGLSLIHI